MPATIKLIVSPEFGSFRQEEHSNVKSLSYAIDWLVVNLWDGTDIRYKLSHVISYEYLKDPDPSNTLVGQTKLVSNAHDVYEVDLNKFMLTGFHGGVPTFAHNQEYPG